ncbi:hypothetical protein [Bacillus sp. MRMR6]|uniref:DUF6954 family protein n=1 Tax=Bacillus sp. MRMR6 TaxID=1928617 RepID=UPI00095303BD|nr:hypothetical protein [Bacillus sp. MRMR6]OLS41404.1 hypothetical protein BTR25_02295 [Bacillus sp. MRMR6]
MGFLKILVHALFILLLLLVTFFGLGPVILADGVIEERIWTLVIVIILYLILAFAYSRAIQWAHKK